MSSTPQAWLVRSGREGERDAWSLGTGVTPGGFDEVPDLSSCSSFDDVKAVVAAAYPDEKAGTQSNFAGQLWSLRNRMETGDYVVLPLKTSKDLDLAIGVISGPYEYRQDEPDPGKRHVRRVEWLSKATRRDLLRKDMRNSLGALLTYGYMKAPDAAQRLQAVLDTGEDPGSALDNIPHSISGLADWAQRVAASANLDAKENDYKREAAAMCSAAREAAANGDPDWSKMFKKMLSKTNTVNFRFAHTLRKALDSNPEEMQAAFDLVWNDGDADNLDALQEALSEVLGHVTAGNATALGAVLLMSVDSDSNAPYNAEPTSRWYKLTDYETGPYTDSATERYRTMLGFLDAVGDELRTSGGFVNASRLEVQGLVWTTIQSAPPERWPAAEREALLRWRGDAVGEPRAWLVRSKNAMSWVESDYVSLPASHLGSPEPGAEVAAIKEAVESGYQHQDYSQRKALVDEYFAFLSTMKSGDMVVALNDGIVHVGVVIDSAEYVEGEGDRLRRPVEWRGSAVEAELPGSLRTAFDRQGSIVDITDELPEVQAIMDGPGVVVKEQVLALRPADEALADKLHMPTSALQEVIDLLSSRKQIVLYGPPGTGKTFVAKALARHVIGTDDPSRMQLVQFHPSYAYEDFFEGYRPAETESGQATFTLQPGPLARIAREAKGNPSHPYVLVIDEMNRANLAKVFGELYFLLEYRNESMQLQYRPMEAFRLPENLFIIGTMNTADRSIALLDAAMRRRFSFVELHPDEEPVKGVLSAWLSRGGHDSERAELLEALNAAIEDQDRDLRIGPSYLMRDEASTDEGLERVWKYDIMPLLEEHYYGRLTRDQIHSRFGLSVLRSTAGGTASAPAASELEADDLFEEDASS